MKARQRGLSLIEAGMALALGLTVLGLSLLGARYYQQNTKAAETVLTVREVTRQINALFGQGRSGYPVGTAVPAELIRVGKLPGTLHATATAGLFEIDGIGFLDIRVDAPVGETRGSQVRLALQFPQGVSGGDSACMQMAKAMRTMAARISATDAQPVDGNGDLLPDAQYQDFWKTRCAQNNMQVIGWTR